MKHNYILCAVTFGAAVTRRRRCTMAATLPIFPLLSLYHAAAVCHLLCIYIHTHTHTYTYICLTREGGAQFPWHFCLNILLGILFLVVIYVIINICAPLSVSFSFFLSLFIVVASLLLLLLLLSFCCCFHLNNNFIANAFNAHLCGARDECYLRGGRCREVAAAGAKQLALS